MKKPILLLLLILSICAPTQARNPHKLPKAYIKDSLPTLVAKCKKLLDGAYMAGELIHQTDTIPGWEGFPVKLYSYQTGVDVKINQSKKGLVYMLNPTPEMLAMWICTTAWEVKGSLDFQYTDKIFKFIRWQSGAQFPVKGVVYEDMYEKGFYEPYVFKDGVTVYVADSLMLSKDKHPNEEQLNYYLRLTNDQIKPQTGRYARIISTNREMYTAWGGNEPVGNTDDRRQLWLDVVRELYKKAYRSDRNELMIAWAKANL